MSILLAFHAEQYNIWTQLLNNTAEHLGYIIHDEVLNHMAPLRICQAWSVASGALSPKIFCDIYLKDIDMNDFVKIFIVLHALVWKGLNTIIESPSTVCIVLCQ